MARKSKGGSPNRKQTITVVDRPIRRPKQRVRHTISRAQILKALQASDVGIAHSFSQMGLNRTKGGHDPAFTRPDMSPVKWSSLGSTDTGRDWAWLALNPCGSFITSCEGIPDTSATPTANPSYRGEYNLGFDINMFAEPKPTTSTTFSLEVVIPPIPEISLIYRIRDDRTGVWSMTRVIRQPGFVNPTTAVDGVTLRSIGYNKYRLMGRGSTFQLDAAGLSDQGRIVAGQFEAITDTASGFSYQLGSTGTPGPVGNDVKYTGDANITTMCVPDTEAYLTNGCPNAYQSEAKNGAYVVQRFTGPLQGQQYHPCGSSTSHDDNTTDYINNAGVAVHLPVSMPEDSVSIIYQDSPYVGDLSENNLQAVYTDDSAFHGTNSTTPISLPDGNRLHPYVSKPCDMTTAVLFFTNLSVGGISATTPGSNIRVKTRTYIEAISGGSPSISPFITKSPLSDKAALENVALIGQMSMDAMPARYNDFGSFMKSVGSGFKMGLDNLGGALSLIPGPIGMAGKLAQLGGMGLGAMGVR